MITATLRKQDDKRRLSRLDHYIMPLMSPFTLPYRYCPPRGLFSGQKPSSHLGVEPRTFGLEVQRAIHCANGTPDTHWLVKMVLFRGTWCTCFGSTYTKIGTIQRRLAWPLRKDDTQNREAFHIFWRPLYRFWDIGLLWFKIKGEMPGLSNILPSFECKG